MGKIDGPARGGAAAPDRVSNGHETVAAITTPMTHTPTANRSQSLTAASSLSIATPTVIAPTAEHIASLGAASHAGASSPPARARALSRSGAPVNIIDDDQTIPARLNGAQATSREVSNNAGVIAMTAGSPTSRDGSIRAPDRARREASPHRPAIAIARGTSAAPAADNQNVMPVATETRVGAPVGTDPLVHAAA